MLVGLGAHVLWRLIRPMAACGGAVGVVTTAIGVSTIVATVFA